MASNYFIKFDWILKLYDNCEVHYHLLSHVKYIFHTPFQIVIFHTKYDTRLQLSDGSRRGIVFELNFDLQTTSRHELFTLMILESMWHCH